MTKGSFFQNNIKKKKRERKIRSLEQKKEEKIKRTEEEIKQISNIISETLAESVSDSQERARQILESEKDEQIHIPKLLLDANIIKAVFLNKTNIIEAIKKYSKEKYAIFTIDRIIIEFIKMEYHLYKNKITFDEVINRLQILGDVSFDVFDWNSVVGQKARDLCKSKKFTDKSGLKKLSETDCYLLELSITKSLVLVSGDHLLIKATTEEARDRNPATKIFDPYESH